MSQQPVMAYPNTLTQQQQQQQQQKPPSDHSNGSFGAVFIVLAVIVVISAIACFLGRLCSRRYHQRPKAAASKHNHHSHHSKKPKERPEATKHNQTFPGEAVDIEFGYDQKGMGSNPKVYGNGSGRPGSGHHHPQHQIHQQQPHDHNQHHGGGGGSGGVGGGGEMRGEYQPRFAHGHEGEGRGGSVEYYNPV